MRVSVIIPAVNEERCIGDSVRSAEAAGAAEVIVVDGGSTDGTCTLASEHATIVKTRAQRAGQMNTGARMATGDVLLFLHADTALHPRAIETIREVFADPAARAASRSTRTRIGLGEIRPRQKRWRAFRNGAV